MSIWERIRGWFTQNTKRFVCVPIAQNRTDRVYDPAPVQADRAYIRIWMAEMLLTKSRDWFKDVQPAVHVLTKLRFADQEIELARVAAPPKDLSAPGRSIRFNDPLLDLVPFRGGTLEFEAALVAVQGEDHLGKAIAVISSFGSLVSTPIASAISVASKIKEGADLLFDQDGQVHLSYHNTFAGAGGSAANSLAPGYYAVVLADTDHFDASQLAVKNDQLCAGLLPNVRPLVGYDHMLFRVEALSSRDDMLHFKDISDLRDAGIQAALRGSVEDGRNLINAAIARVLTHPELIAADRRVVASQLNNEFHEVTTNKATLGGAVASEPRKPNAWSDFVAALPVALDHTEPKFEEFIIPQLTV